MICTNISTCRLVNGFDYEIDQKKKEEYINGYCDSKTEKWKICKRFITKDKLSFCPDFVMPNTTLTPIEIVDKFDEDESLQ